MQDQAAAPDGEPTHNRPTVRVLLFTLKQQNFALRASAVNGLGNCETIRRVPGAPKVVLGLSEWRGDLLTVIDLPRLLGISVSDPQNCLVRLAHPLQGTALFLPGRMRLAEISEETEQPFRLLDAAVLVRRVENAVWEERKV